ncbi:spindle pole body component 110-like [Notechis scutatus]|uniref:Spindle pole body component 110-like n=1 Tax=Notechis scutatus TaxID=8663 RepID=A0A6J1TT19_9SAUR|nr:spindle pole body component 110-like [Notechis scutatus]
MENTLLCIESEYIKNLQQQIYFLELEAKFLREQTKKAIHTQPFLACEMEHMLQNLQTLQCKADSLDLELRRKKDGLNMLMMERNQLNNQISMANEQHLKEKQGLIEEIRQWKKKKAEKDEQISGKQIEITYAKQELEEQQMNLKNKEQTILMLKTKVTQQLDRQKAMELQLSEKKKEFLEMQSAIHEMEEKILKKTAAMHEQITHELRNEISFLHHQIRERELLAEQDRLLRSKIADDYAVLTKENNLLQSRFLELVKQMNIERVLKEEMYTTHSMSIAQFLTVKDQEEQLQREIKTHQDLLKQEMSTFQELEDKISLLEKRSTTVDLNIATLSSRIAEVRAMLEKEEDDNIELKRENSLLIDFASNLKKQLAGKENSLLEASNKMLGLDEAISALKMKHTLHQSLQSEKWDKVSKMANTMMKLSNSMVNIIDRIGKE